MGYGRIYSRGGLLPEDIKQLVTLPSLGGIVYQAHGLCDELNGITEDEYPKEACYVRDILLCVTRAILRRLEGLYNPKAPRDIKDAKGNTYPVQDLARALHSIYAGLRFLRASAPLQSPPALQVAFTELANEYFPEASGRALCLVRPQWKYNFGTVTLLKHLEEVLTPHLFGLDSDMYKSPAAVLHQLWIQDRPCNSETRDKEPRQIGILSFAGLDTNDTLLSSLLAHELGHFITQASEPSILSECVTPILQREFAEIAPREFLPVAEQETARLNEDLRRAASEMLCDLIAARILGFAYFAALASYLKTVEPGDLIASPRTIPTLTRDRHPGIRWRLCEILREVTRPSFNGSILKGVKEGRKRPSNEASALNAYVHYWREYLADGDNLVRDLPEMRAPVSTDLLLHAHLRSSMQLLRRAARRIVPRERSARMSPAFWERVDMLRGDLPPVIAPETIQSYSEILSAAWVYELLWGEQREFEESNRLGAEQLAVYRRTCRLVLKAIELQPLARTRVATQKIRRRSRLQSKGAVLGHDDILSRLSKRLGEADRIAIIPIAEHAVQGASVDLRLGNRFSIRQTVEELGHTA